MIEAYNAIIDKINANTELLSDEELVNAMNKLTEAFDKADQYFTSPEKLTPEVMSALKVVIEEGRTFVAKASAALDEISQ
jgi:hypothetical protein